MNVATIITKWVKGRTFESKNYVNSLVDDVFKN